ncbi:hypothetical protein [Sphingomonas sp. T9W2]|uniref:hypothetical protein n=1 Tax=Sphingomonas sp. T9W2 TaxID=3143183 RepID=UPI0031F4EE3C
MSFNQLNPDLSAKNAPEGAVYYLPKPVLLVSVDPKAAGGESNPGQPGVLPAPAAPAAPPAGPPRHAPAAPPPAPGPAGGWGGGQVGGADDATKSKDSAAAPAADGSDQSYSVAVPGYTLKLIYLPDRSRPMRLSVHAGFGTASLKPTLQNGWMLTGFDAAADSKASELLASVAQLVTAAKGPAAAAEASTKGGGAGGRGEAADSGILRPGLYDFKYGDKGQLVGLCPLTYFTSRGPITPSEAPEVCK